MRPISSSVPRRRCAGGDQIGAEAGAVLLQPLDLLAQRRLPALGDRDRAADRLELRLARLLPLVGAALAAQVADRPQLLSTSVAGADGPPQSERAERRKSAAERRRRIVIAGSYDQQSVNIMPDDRGGRKGSSSRGKAARPAGRGQADAARSCGRTRSWRSARPRTARAEPVRAADDENRSRHRGGRVLGRGRGKACAVDRARRRRRGRRRRSPRRRAARASPLPPRPSGRRRAPRATSGTSSHLEAAEAELAAGLPRPLEIALAELALRAGLQPADRQR